MDIFKHVEDWTQKNDPQAPKPSVRNCRHYSGSLGCPSLSRPDFRPPMSEHQGSGGDLGGSRAQAGPQLPLSLAQSRDALPCDCDIKEGMPTKPLPWLPAAGRWPARVRPPSTLISSAGRREASSSARWALWQVPCYFSSCSASAAWAAWRCVSMVVTAGCGPNLVHPRSCLWDDTLQKGQKLLVSTGVQPPGSSRLPLVIKGLAPYYHSRSANRPAVS